MAFLDLNNDYSIPFQPSMINVILNAIQKQEIPGIAIVVLCTPKRFSWIESSIIPLISRLISTNYLTLVMGCGNSLIATNNFLCSSLQENENNAKIMNKTGDKLRKFCVQFKVPPILLFGPCFSIQPVKEIIENINQLADYFEKIKGRLLPLVLFHPIEFDQEYAVNQLFPIDLGKGAVLKEIPFSVAGRFFPQYQNSSVTSIEEDDPVWANLKQKNFC